MFFRFLLAFFLLVMPTAFFAASSDTSDQSVSATSFGTPGTSTDESLSVKNVKVLDDMHVQVIFSEDIVVESVRAQIVKQSDGSTLRVESVTGVTLAPDAVNISLANPLAEGSTYSTTVLSAVSISGIHISDGALAIKDFITPVPLKKSTAIALNAPANPDASVSNNTNNLPLLGNTNTAGTTVADTPTTKAEPEVTTPVPADELPLTGLNSLYLLLAVLPIAYLLMRKKAV